MKKLSLLIIMVFLISVFGVIAKNDGANLGIAVMNKERAVEKLGNVIEEKQERIRERIGNCEDDECRNMLENRIVKIEKLSENAKKRLEVFETRRLEKLNNINVSSTNKEFAKFVKEREFKARALDKIRLEKAKANFLKAKENFEEAQKKYRERKEEFLAVRNESKNCEEDCNEVRERLRTKTGEYLLNSADVILEHLNKVREKIEGSEDLTEEEAQEILAKIDAKIKEIEEAKTIIENATTQEEIVEAAKNINAKWKNMKEEVKIYVMENSNAKLGRVIVKTNHLELRLENVLSKMVEEGIDTTSLQSKIDEFNSKIEAAKVKYEEAVSQLKNNEDASELMKEARDLLKEANILLRNILKEIKANNLEDELEEEA